MIEGGWAYIWPAYAVTLGGLAVLALIVTLRLLHWTKRAKPLNSVRVERRQ